MNVVADTRPAAFRPLVAVTQRVEVLSMPDGSVERRDALDQAWISFLAACNCAPLLLPNHAQVATQALRDHPVDLLLLTGGNDLVACGGDAPERDETEAMLFALARKW